MSITGQVGHVALAKQSTWDTGTFSNVISTESAYRAVKITGDSLVASNNQLIAEGEIGSGRDVTQAVPGGFSSAGAINGNLRARSAAVLLFAAMGTGAAASPVDNFDVADTLPFFTIEKKVGTNARTAAELLTIQYSNAMVNTLNISASSGALATFSAGIIAAQERYISAPIVTSPSYGASSDDLLLFHGGRIKAGDSGSSWSDDATFQSMEMVINNNIQADEYTIRPSRFLRSLTEGIRSVECNMTIVFEDYASYQKYTYGASGSTSPGYSLYMGQLDLTLANWQIVTGDSISTGSPTGAPALPQAVNIIGTKYAFSGLPVALSTGRIAVSTSARALKPASGNIIDAATRPTLAGFSSF
jgi:hypothetical protein